MEEQSSDSEPVSLDRENIGRQIRYFRIQKGLRQSELAAKANVSITTLYQVENGHPARISSIKKICEVGLETKFAALIQARNKTVREKYLLYRSGTARWLAMRDFRKSVPEDNPERIQEKAERVRLGRLGFVPAFIYNPSIVMPDGPGTFFIELYFRLKGPINPGVFRDCKMYCQEGQIRCMVAGDELELGVGDMIGCQDADVEWIEPLSPEDAPATVLWMGAVRTGKAVYDHGRRVIVRPPGA